MKFAFTIAVVATATVATARPAGAAQGVAAKMTWGMPTLADHTRMRAVDRLELAWAPQLFVLAIGVSGLSSFRSAAYLEPGGWGVLDRSPGASLCLGASCPSLVTLTVNDATKTSGMTGSTRLIAGIGPIGVAALAMFARPVSKRQGSIATRVLPMFAGGGGGLELRGVWW